MGASRASSLREASPRRVPVRKSRYGTHLARAHGRLCVRSGRVFARASLCRARHIAPRARPTPADCCVRRAFTARNGYNLAIYSDDRGQTWHVSDPLPVDGAGEGCVVELSDGRILYSSRQHHFADDASMRWERLYAISHDGGVSWREGCAQRGAT